MAIDEQITTKEQWYDLKKYKEEIQAFVAKKKNDLDKTSKMEQDYEVLYRTVYAGSVEADKERFPHAAEMFKVYKSAIIESSLAGYSALVEVDGEDAKSVLKAPLVKKAMTEQFKGMSLLEKLSGETLDDWIFKGEAISLIKLNTRKEEFRLKETITDPNTGEDIIRFSVKEGVTYEDIDIERIDPLDFFVDAYDYEKDPIGCTKIIRSYIDSKTLLTSNAYPLLSQDDKEAIIYAAGRNGRYATSCFDFSGGNMTNGRYNKTDKDQIEVLTFHGDYITSDHKVLSNIKAVLINNMIASLRYNTVSTNRIIYAPYKIDRQTHRSISPLASSNTVNKLVNRVCDMFIQNMDDVCNPYLLYQKGSISAQQMRQAREKREIEYNDATEVPQFWAPPPATQNGLQLMELILQQNKNVLGLNNYMAGDTSGSVRTAEESSILFQRANARMRVETDVFSYRYMLNLFMSFYAFNRELALAYDKPLKEIYADPELKVSISTNASKADKQGELQRLMQMLNLPIAQMIFSNLNPEQVVLAVRYLMAKADLTDVDNLLQLVDESGNIQTPQEGDEDMIMGVEPDVAPTPLPEANDNNTMM